MDTDKLESAFDSSSIFSPANVTKSSSRVSADLNWTRSAMSTSVSACWYARVNRNASMSLAIGTTLTISAKFDIDGELDGEMVGREVIGETVGDAVGEEDAGETIGDVVAGDRVGVIVGGIDGEDD